MSDERTEKLRAIVSAVLDRKGENVLALDVRELASFTDGFVIATGTSDRHVRALADAVLATPFRTADALAVAAEAHRATGDADRATALMAEARVLNPDA